MAKTLTNEHYCAAARALEVIGEKWSLLVVRDLLSGEQRFSDLLRSLGGITPKLLTHRLRDLEAHGVVERDEEEGRREVWYRLTAAGRELRPTIESLIVWGIDHAPPPSPDETTYSNRSASAVVAMLNKRGIRPDQNVIWKVRSNESPGRAIRFDGDRWRLSIEPDVAVDLDVAASVEVWVKILQSGSHSRGALLPQMKFDGEPAHVKRFHRLLGHPEG
jgi:DNA-binding HxlR family transcriptional regulator